MAMVVLRRVYGPGCGVGFVHRGMQAGALVVFHPPAEAVHHHVIDTVVGFLLRIGHGSPTRESAETILREWGGGESPCPWAARCCADPPPSPWPRKDPWWQS